MKHHFLTFVLWGLLYSFFYPSSVDVQMCMDCNGIGSLRLEAIGYDFFIVVGETAAT